MNGRLRIGSMPRDGAIIFGDLLGKLDMLHVACDKCGRKGRYAVVPLIEKRERDAKVLDLLAEIAADCPKKQAGNMTISARPGVLISLGSRAPGRGQRWGLAHSPDGRFRARLCEN